MKLFAFILTAAFSMVQSQPFDEILKAPVDHVFVSVGFTYIDDSQWHDRTSLANQFEKDTILLVSIPQISGTTPVVVKMKQETVLNADKTVSFSIRLVQPNDSFCVKTWYVPQFLPSIQVAWMVFEVGAYTVNSFPFIAGKGQINRASWSTSATFTNGNLVAISFPTGCISSTDVCVLNAANRGGINLLQTNINVKEAGKVLYLSVRAKIIDLRRGQWVLVPHDVAIEDAAYHQLTFETLGYLTFQVGIQIECFEKMVWETASDVVNYEPNVLGYKNTYDYPPGLFGIVGTITSLADTILKSSNWKVNQSTFAINEDQCVTEENRHTTLETVYTVVVGEKQATTSTYQCYVNFNSALNPTPIPTKYPTRTPTSKPSTLPTFSPSRNPTFAPSRNPTFAPTRLPTFKPSTAPTFTPSTAPTFKPSTNPTFKPSTNPTFTPSTNPTFTPSTNPTFTPSTNPTFTPSSNPTFAPSTNPTFKPSTNPTFSPTANPSVAPTVGATAAPTNICSNSFPVEMYKE
jgi:hypothetical protein